jgi:hypothetical protein
MCRSIKVLRQGDVPLLYAEVREAALRFVRKISEYRHPSQVNAEAFEKAVDDIAAVSQELLGALVNRPARSRSL